MTKPFNKTITPVPDDNQSHKGPGSAPNLPLDTTKGHRDDEKHNIREQAAHRSEERRVGKERSARGGASVHQKQRSAQLFAERCAAEPGPTSPRNQEHERVPALRSSVKTAA